MRNRARTYIAAFFYYTGLIKLICWWTRRSGRSLIILYYHRASGKNLRRQWLYLRRNYRILPLTAALEALHLPDEERAYKRDRRTLLAITFDDGYHDNYTHAFALASSLQIPMTIFVIPGYTGCANSFWWADRLLRLAQTDQLSFAGHTYRLDRPEERKALAQTIDEQMSNAPSAAEQKKLLLTLAELLAVSSTALATEEPAPLVTWEQIQEMEKSGWVSFGAHTVHHPDLARLTDAVEVQDEVGGSRKMLEQQLGHAVETFAYPYGHVGNYGLAAVQQTGYQWAVTTIPGFNTRQSNPHLLYRRSADPGMRVWEVAASTTGVWTFFVAIKKRAKLLFHVVRHPKTQQSL